MEEGRVAAAGGTVEQTRMSIGEYGYIALVRDPGGNRTGLHSMAWPHAPQRVRGGKMGKNRLEAFSDGVLAIVITIMVLELKVPVITSYSIHYTKLYEAARASGCAADFGLCCDHPFDR